MPPGTKKEMADFMKAPLGGTGGLMAPGTKMTITSITGGEEVYPNFPAAKFCWSTALNNADVAGVVNYDEFHARVGMLSMALACSKKGQKNWPTRVQERVVTDIEEMLGEGMYNIKKSVSGRAAVVMNPMDKIQKALKVAKKLYKD